MTYFRVPFLCLVLVCAAHGAMAQERAAGGTLETQMTWKALSAKVDDANTKSAAVGARVDQVVQCGYKGKVYAPGAAGVDAGGCKDAAVPATLVTEITNLTTITNNSLECSGKDLTYNKATKTCEYVEPDQSLNIFAVKAGFDAGVSMDFSFNLSSGAGKVVAENGVFGNRYVRVPKLDYSIVCGKKKRNIELLTQGVWWGIPRASGHKVDQSIDMEILQHPTCANGLVGIARVSDDTTSQKNDQWSVGTVILMKAE